MKLIPTGSQTVGPFFHFGIDRPEWSDLTVDGVSGEKIVVEGCVTDGDGAPIPDALLEIWQANAAGKYDHPEDTQDKPVDKKFRGFGRAATNAQGIYRFTTIKPGPVPGRGNALQAPHINVTVFARGLLKHLTTRLYFADEAAANETDPVLNSIDDAAARKTLIADKANGTALTYRFNIVLQGNGETVFFEI